MEDLLFLAHRIPYPPNKGDKIRSWNILRHLTEKYRVHLGCFVDDPEDWQYERNLREICSDCLFVPLNPVRARLASARALLTGEPLTLAYYRSRAMTRWISALRDRIDFRRVFIFSSSMAQYVPQGLLGDSRLVVDFVDVDSDKWAQYAKRKNFPASWVYRREARTLSGLERRVAENAHACLLVSEAEAQLFRDLSPVSGDRVYALNNGVDFDFFDPEREYPNPYSGAKNVMVFTGQMNYWANADAVIWFAHDIFPKIRERVSDAEFWVVGANPTREVSRLANMPGVEVTGRVPDIRPFLHHAHVVVAPLRVARGIQNKVLEAMAMAKIVVATPEAADGILANPGKDLIVVAETSKFVDEIIEFLTDCTDCNERGIGRVARETIILNYSWGTNLSSLNRLLEGQDL
jgi:sugar transferase (PEP-CTERM/EpsH1 system associated)